MSGHPALKLNGTIEQLTPPGSKSNYQEWRWVMEVHLDSTDVWYVIASPKEEAKAQSLWVRNNKAVVGVISKTIHLANICNILHLKNNGRGLWNTLKGAHQDTSTGGIMYWLQNLTSARMTGDDLESHLTKMAKAFDCLSSLVADNRPLTPNNIYATSILMSLPSKWLL
jgi:hypothetical protein